MPLYRRDLGLKRASARGGFVLRKVKSPELAIASISARGDVAVLASTPPAAVLESGIQVRRSGYVMNAGDAAPVLSTWNETVFLTKRRITPGGSQSAGFVGNEVMLSKVITANDALANQPSAVINSTRSGPQVEFRWISPGYRVVGNTASASGTTNSFYTRNGSPVAAVAFVWRDEFGGVVRAYCRVPTAYTGFGVTGYSAHQWAVSNVDISSLRDSAAGGGRISEDWELYGHHGQLIASSDAGFATLNASRWWHGRRYLRKYVAMAAAPLYAYIRPGSPDASPICSTNAATARSRPFGTWQAARDAADDANLAAYSSLGSVCLDGVIFRLMDTGSGGNVIAAPTLSSASICIMAGFIVEHDPLGTWSPRPVLNGWTSQLSTTSNPNSQIGYTIRGFDITRTGTTVFSNPSAGAAGNPIANIVNVRAYIEAPTGGGTFDLGSTGLSSIFSNAYGHIYGFTFPTDGGSAFASWTASQGISAFYDCVISNYSNRVLNNYALVCVRGLSVGSVQINGTANGASVSSFMDAVRIEQTTTNATTGILDGANNNTAPLMMRNTELVVLNSTENNRLGLSQDNLTYSMRDAFGHHCTIPSLSGACRGNTFYVDGAAGGGRDHQYCGFTNSVLPPLANKGDWFGVANVADAAREPGYREFSYGLGCKGNFYTSLFALSQPGFEIETQRYLGLGCIGSISGGPNRNSGPYTNPGFLDSRVPTAAGGANGSVGGDYRHTYTMPTISSADVLFDIAGRTVPLNCIRPGAHSGWSL